MRFVAEVSANNRPEEAESGRMLSAIVETRPIRLPYGMRTNKIVILIPCLFGSVYQADDSCFLHILGNSHLSCTVIARGGKDHIGSLSRNWS